MLLKVAPSLQVFRPSTASARLNSKQRYWSMNEINKYRRSWAISKLPQSSCPFWCKRISLIWLPDGAKRSRAVGTGGSRGAIAPTDFAGGNCPHRFYLKDYVFLFQSGMGQIMHTTILTPLPLRTFLRSCGDVGVALQSDWRNLRSNR